MKNKAFVLGLDGVPWRLIEEWTEQGELPNFERVMREGAAGPFDSTRPATTPVAWPSISRGVRADKHGLYGFHKLKENYSHKMNTSNDIDTPPLWEMVSPSIVANVPMTYPASEIDGTMVSGMIAPEKNDQFTYPPEFKTELEEEIPEYQISIPWGDYTDNKQEFLAEFDRLVGARRKLMRLLMNRSTDWELFFFVYTGPDRLQHLCWGEDVILEHYRELDDILGETMKYVSEVGGNLYIVSDHGFGKTDRQIHVNRILQDAGYLSEKDLSGTRGLLARIGVDRSDITKGLAKFGLDEDHMLSLFPRGLVDSVAQKMPGDHALYDVDFEKTAAFLHFSGAVYINDTERFEDGIIDPADAPALKRELITLFESATDPETGEKPLVVYDGDERFPTDAASPDLILSGRRYYMLNNQLDGQKFSDIVGCTAGHEDEGIFLAWGSDIESGATPNDATVYDFASTVLHSLGRPVPELSDGRVLSEIFAKDSKPAKESVKTNRYSGGDSAVDIDDNFDDVEDRLKGLGYLS